MKQSQNEVLVQFVAKLTNALGSQVASVVLYGSAASEDFSQAYSDMNVLVVVKQADEAALKAMSPAVGWWVKQGQPAPVVFSREELARSADVFAIELLDMKERHRTLHGEDLIGTIEAPKELHRVQVERELRTALVKLRQGFLQARNEEEISRLMSGSISTFATLFRHALLVFGEKVPIEKRAAVEAVGRYLAADVTAMLRVLDMREKRAAKVNCSELFSAYLAAVTKVTHEVDRRLR